MNYDSYFLLKKEWLFETYDLNILITQNIAIKDFKLFVYGCSIIKFIT